MHVVSCSAAFEGRPLGATRRASDPMRRQAELPLIVRAQAAALARSTQDPVALTLLVRSRQAADRHSNARIAARARASAGSGTPSPRGLLSTPAGPAPCFWRTGGKAPTGRRHPHWRACGAPRRSDRGPRRSSGARAVQRAVPTPASCAQARVRVSRLTPLHRAVQGARRAAPHRHLILRAPRSHPARAIACDRTPTRSATRFRTPKRGSGPRVPGPLRRRIRPVSVRRRAGSRG